MALVAIRAVVDIPTDIGMLEIRCIIVAMATGALEHRVIARVGVAGCTNAVRVAVIRWEVRVIERGSGPTGRGVAGIASRRETSGRVIGIGRPRVIRLVTAVASRGQRRVVVVHVALHAGHVRRVISGQRECRGVVIEGGTGPIRRRPGRVASVARGREAHGRVRRAIRAVVIRLVAGDACRARQTVRTGWAEGRVVALRALQGRVRALQGKAG